MVFLIKNKKSRINKLLQHKIILIEGERTRKNSPHSPSKKSQCVALKTPPRSLQGYKFLMSKVVKFYF